MDEETSSEDTPSILRRFAAGDDDALEKYYARHNGELVRGANRAVRSFQLDPADIDAEEAVNSALLELCRVRDQGRLRVVTDGEEFKKLILMMVRGILKREKSRSRAIKRGGGGFSTGKNGREGAVTENGGEADWGFQRNDVDLDQLSSPAPSAEQGQVPGTPYLIIDGPSGA
jgi:hypothetical protein